VGTTSTPERPYHHGDLRRALIDAALDEIAAEGPARLSLRHIARRAGVSHAAPAHHFKDKAGVFTAIAIEGFTLLASDTTEASHAPGALVQSALAYIRFAVQHPAHFEVMWRPDLYHQDDQELVAARGLAFEVFYTTVGAAVGVSDGEGFNGAAVAAWSLVHGFATLSLSGNLPPEMGDDPIAAALVVGRGSIAVAEVTARELPLVDR